MKTEYLFIGMGVFSIACLCLINAVTVAYVNQAINLRVETLIIVSVFLLYVAIYIKFLRKVLR